MGVSAEHMVPRPTIYHVAQQFHGGGPLIASLAGEAAGLGAIDWPPLDSVLAGAGQPGPKGIRQLYTRG